MTTPPNREAVEQAISEFYQANWTGPTCHEETEGVDLTPLIVDGEWPYRLVSKPRILSFALQHLHLVSDAWKLRALFMHQLLLEQPSATLKEKLLSLSADPLEKAMVLAYYQEDCKEALSEAAKQAGFSWSLTGQLGRRTVHQANSIHQLVVQVEVDQEAKRHCPSQGCCQPHVVPLVDDHLLDQVKLDGNQVSNLSALQQAVLLGQVQAWWRTQAQDPQLQEKATALIDACIASGSQQWLIYSAALYHRARLQMDRPRLIERACLQIQALVDQTALQEPSAAERIDWRMLGIMPPIWLLDAEQGSLFARLGVFKTAMAIFERRQLWPQTLRCMIQVGQKEAATLKLHRLLEECPTDPALWCLRGEVEQNPEFFERAWQVSNHRYAQAQRSLAAWHYGKEEWALAAECFNTALAINALHPRCWFLLGLCYQQLQSPRQAAHAFSRAVALDSDLVDGWMHLAQAQRQQGNAKEALLALREASRLDTQNGEAAWSLLQVAMEMGEIPEAIQAYRRFLQSAGAHRPDSKLDAIQFHPNHPLSPLYHLCGLYGRAKEAQAPINMLQVIQRQLKLLITEAMMAEYAGEPLFWQAISMLHEAGEEREEAIEALLSAMRLLLNRGKPTDEILVKAKTLSRNYEGLLADRIAAVEQLVTKRAEKQ